ncbi:MAG: glycosyltransferase [Candidatus Bathyarchaeia archaeon]
MIQALTPQLEDAIRKLKGADYLIGIPSYNNAGTIGHVLLKVAEGLSKFFPNQKNVIIISDGGSTDGTREIASSLKLRGEIKKFVTLYKGVSGKGSAVRLIFEAAQILNVRGVALLDADLRSIKTEWIKLLLKPLERDEGLVTPLYRRYKYDGTITNLIIYPFTRAIYGIRVRQPIGGEFGISRALIERLLASPLWDNPYTPRFGIDVFITHTAIALKFHVVEAWLGVKIHDAKDPTKHLAPMFRQVVGSMFSIMELYESRWRSIKGSCPVPVVKNQFKIQEPNPFTVDIAAPIKTFKEEFAKYSSLYKSIMSINLYNELVFQAKRDKMDISIPADTWAKVAYTFAAAFKKEKQQEKRELMLDALRLCWNGRIGTFMQETFNMTEEQAEEKILQEAKTFEELKPYLIEIY